MELTAAETVVDFHDIPFSSLNTDMCLMNQIEGKSNGNVMEKKYLIDISEYFNV